MIGWAEVVTLGRQLTRQLGDGRDDIALSWMAHHVARLMSEAEAAEGAEADQAQERCRRAILDLWKARRAIFDRMPMQSVEDVGAAVLSLKDGNGWFFHRMADDEHEPARAIQLAYAVDAGARAIIRTLVGDAVRQGLADEKEWIWLVGSGLPDIEPIVLLVQEAMATSPPTSDATAGDSDGDGEPSDAEGADGAAKRPTKSERNDIIKKLSAFALVAEEIAGHLAAPRPPRKGARKRVQE